MESATSFVSSSLDELAARPSRFRHLTKQRYGPDVWIEAKQLAS